MIVVPKRQQHTTDVDGDKWPVVYESHITAHDADSDVDHSNSIITIVIINQ